MYTKNKILFYWPLLCTILLAYILCYVQEIVNVMTGTANQMAASTLFETSHNSKGASKIYNIQLICHFLVLISRIFINFVLLFKN